jgi:hypothetical protein
LVQSVPGACLVLLACCTCLDGCAFCTDEVGEGPVTVQAVLTLTNDKCTGGTAACTDIDGTYVLAGQGTVPYPTNGDLISGTTGEGNACQWTFTSQSTECTTDDCDAVTCSPDCPDHGNSCDPMIPGDCDGSECTVSMGDTADCQAVIDCIATTGTLSPETPEDRCDCNEDSPGSGTFTCDCSATTCAPLYTCSTNAAVDVYLYSADSNTKRVLYVTLTLEQTTYHGYHVEETDTLDCRDALGSVNVSLAVLSSSGAAETLCTPPTEITIEFI